MPKTGGTSMNRLFRELDIPGVQVDVDGSSAKHDSITMREARGSLRAGTRHRFITARRLPSWLLSDWNHKRRHMGLHDLPFEPVRCGLFYSLRLGGIWVAADWWLEYFDLSDAVQALRLEHLAEDINRHLLPLLPAGHAPLPAPPLENANSGITTGSEWFQSTDLQRLYEVNPRWQRWEQQVYGSIWQPLPRP